MRRGDRFGGLVSLVLTLALAAYLGAWFFGAVQNRLSTAEAVYARIEQDFSARGIIIREEMLLDVPEKAQMLAPCGLRLGVGDTIALAGDESFTAPRAGLLSQADGFESLSPQVLEELDAPALAKLLDSSPQAAGHKLVLGTNWYFAAIIPAQLAGQLEPGQVLELQNAGCSGEIIRISEENQSECVLILRFDSNMAKMLDVRILETAISLGRLEGLRIPAQALREGEDGQFFVRTLTATLPEDKPVTVLHRQDDWVLVALEDDPDALRAGNMVIIDENM